MNVSLIGAALGEGLVAAVIYWPLNPRLSVVLNLIGHPVMAMEYHATSVAIALELKLDYEDVCSA